MILDGVELRESIVYDRCIRALAQLFCGQDNKKLTEVEILRLTADTIEAVKKVNWPKLIQLANNAVVDPDFRRYWLVQLFNLLGEGNEAFLTFVNPDEWRGYTLKELEEKRKAEEEEIKL